jgi:hypothetical protein
MNLVDVAKQEGLDKDIALDILTKCIPHNKSLSLFTETFMVEDIPGVFAEKLINAYNNSQVNLKTGSVISPSEELSKIKVCINPPVFLVTVNEEVENEAIEDNYNIYITCKSSDGRLLCLQGTSVSGEFTHKAGINLRYKKDIKTPVLKRLMDENACVSLNTFMMHPEVDIVELTLVKKHYKKFKNFTVSCQRNGKSLQSKSIRDKMNTQNSTTIFRLRFKDNKWEYELCPEK